MAPLYRDAVHLRARDDDQLHLPLLQFPHDLTLGIRRRGVEDLEVARGARTIREEEKRGAGGEIEHGLSRLRVFLNEVDDRLYERSVARRQVQAADPLEPFSGAPRNHHAASPQTFEPLHEAPERIELALQI